MSTKPTGYGLENMSYEERLRAAYAEMIRLYPPKNGVIEVPEGFATSLNERYGLSGPTEAELAIHTAFNLELKAEALMRVGKEKGWIK
jgi:hypothetical protein